MPARMWRKGNILPLLVEVQTYTITLEISLEVFKKKLEIVLLEDSNIPLQGIYLKDAPPCPKNVCSTIFIAALFEKARNWK